MRESGALATATRGLLVIVLALTVQTSLVRDLQVAGAFGDVLLLVGIAAAIADGPQRGAAFGFAAGMAFDLLQPDIPLGLSALAYCITGYLVGSIQGSVLRATWWIPMMSAAAASALGVVLFVVLGKVLGEQIRLSDLPAILLMVSVLNGLLALPAVRLMRWVIVSDRGPRLGALAR